MPRQYTRRPIVERFWEKVDRSGGSDTCWLWTDGRNASGYGRVWMGGRRGRAIMSHRFSWELHNGEIPDGLCVLHRCDTRHCVNPAHLFLGTKADNIADMLNKGRQPRGATHGRQTKPERTARGERLTQAKLTDAAVRDIRRRYAAGGITQQVLADEYGIARSKISAVICRRTWRHVD